jgi:hypothetical protein
LPSTQTHPKKQNPITHNTHFSLSLSLLPLSINPNSQLFLSLQIQFTTTVALFLDILSTPPTTTHPPLQNTLSQRQTRRRRRRRRRPKILTNSTYFVRQISRAFQQTQHIYFLNPKVLSKSICKWIHIWKEFSIGV